MGSWSYVGGYQRKLSHSRDQNALGPHLLVCKMQVQSAFGQPSPFVRLLHHSFGSVHLDAIVKRRVQYCMACRFSFLRIETAGAAQHGCGQAEQMWLAYEVWQRMRCQWIE